MSEEPLRTVGTLNGWKEISSYLGKSVRAVQRWERDFGLPVHRIRTPTGQVVYAFRAEIDAWRLTLRERPADDEPAREPSWTPAEQDAVAPATALADDDPLPFSPTAPSRFGHRRFLAVSALIAAGAMLAVGAMVVTTRVGAVTLHASVYEVSGTSLVALTQDRRKVWSHDFGWQPQRLDFGPELTARTMSADLDGDGHDELLAVIRAPAAGGQPWQESVFCFSDTGALRWSYTPSLNLTYEGRAFERPWRNYAIAASTESGRQHVWVSFGHHTWWPSFVVELDAGGSATPRYFQSGAIYHLAKWSTGSGDYLVATGVDNEYARASVAVLKIDAPASTSPQHQGTGFHCDSCPAGGPEFFAALPRSELNRLSGFSYNSAGHATGIGNDLTLYTYEFGFGLAASVVYSVRSDFTFQNIGLTDGYAEKHRQLEAEGKITHAFKDCPGRRDPLALLTWRRSQGWREASVAIGLAPQPAR